MQRVPLLFTGLVTRTYSKRILKRMRGHPRTWPAREEPIVPAPSYPVQPIEALPSGWVPPSGSVAENIPFQVNRTTMGQQLPVYTDYRNGRTRSLTIVRRVSGNTAVLVEELRRVTGGAEVEARPGRVQVEGDKAKEIKTWLAGLGF